MIVAIDGPAGAGKSTVARKVARALGLAFLDTGAMYRAVTLVVLEKGIHPSNAQGCAAVARSTELAFDADGRIWIDGVRGEPDIRSRTVTLNVSAVSAHPEVREAVVALQRRIAERPPGVVAEGRDTTTVVFPDADHKFFLTASPEERARRRAAELGTPERAGEIRQELEQRDEQDSRRAHSPLVHAPEAVLLDTDRLSVDEAVAAVLEAVRTGSSAR